MSHYHYGDDGDMWVYPPPDEWGEAPEHIEAVRVECQLFVEADDAIEQTRRMQAENARLRELARDYENCTMHADCAGCEHDGKLSTHCPLSPCFPDSDELRGLGVEVDDA